MKQKNMTIKPLYCQTRFKWRNTYSNRIESPKFVCK